MKKMVYTLAVAMLILIAMVIVPATAESSSNEKIPIIIVFKDKSDAALVKAYGGEIKYQYHVIPAIAASLPKDSLTILKNNPNVAYIEEDADVHVLVDDSSTPWEEDDDDETPWGVDRIDAEKAHKSGFTGDGVKVAIIDSGIDYNHPDLSTNYYGGHDFVNGDLDPMDDNGHGTHVAGTIAAADDNYGVVGVAPDAELYALKALNKGGVGKISDINAAIQWAIDNDMDVISMSIGGGYSESQESMCKKAYGSGIVIVAAAGNTGDDSLRYPAAYDSVIAVSATTDQDVIATFSTVGSQVELAAPGENINSTRLGGGYIEYDGTSMATPHVSGVVALLLSSNVSSGISLDRDYDGQWDPEEVRARLNETAYSLDNESTSSDDYYFGNGLVNASEALKDLTVADVPTPTNPTVSVINDVYSKGKFTWAIATVTVTDNSGPCEGVNVEGYWIINGEESDITPESGNTNEDGEVIFTYDEPLPNPNKDMPFSFVFNVTTTEYSS